VAPAPLWPEDVDFFGQQPPEDVLVAEVDGAVVGYVKLRRPTDLPSHRHVLQVNGLAVDPTVQRRGVGRTLLVAAIDEARRRGARRLTLHVLGSNPGALALYAACGFVVEGCGAASSCWKTSTWTTCSWPCPWSRAQSRDELLGTGTRGDLSRSHQRDVVRS
jgi:predicted N-acetyltransferase YhbS